MKTNIYQASTNIYKHKGEVSPLILVVCPHCKGKNLVNYKTKKIQCPCKGDAIYVKAKKA